MIDQANVLLWTTAITAELETLTTTIITAADHDLVAQVHPAGTLTVTSRRLAEDIIASMSTFY